MVFQHFQFYIELESINQSSKFWQTTFYRLLRFFSNCVANKNKQITLHSILAEKLLGLHAITPRNDETCAKVLEEKENLDPNTKDTPKPAFNTALDLKKYMAAMNSAFTAPDRLTGEETEPFMYRCKQTIDGMRLARTPDEF